MTLIKDLINIPTQVLDGDFVLKLTQGIADDAVKATVDSYVVTDQIAKSFDESLGLVASAVRDGTSKAAFLQGSFGSGKSHFMAMLHLLLTHNPYARSKPELHGPVSKHANDLDGKNFLLVPAHFLNAKSMEQQILGGYISAIERAHPDATLPPVFLGDTIVAAELPTTRSQHGEEKFLALLGAADDDGDDWGDFAGGWTTEKVDAALAAKATDKARLDLVAAYIAAFRPATRLETATSGEGFVDLDSGLGAISRHAQTLGYSGIVLFLDELILWLASKIGDINFVQDESQKLTKLVEATDADRPVPIISLVARQRDLRDLVGTNIAGNEFKSFSDNLAYQQGRFGEIKLASGNLPKVAQKRLLVPKDDAAASALAGAVDAALAGNESVKQVLLGTDADVELFRTVYPFSPALVETLIDVSEALQRERTALKVMLQILVNKRDTLEIGEIIPVGDLWDVVSARDEPFSSELAQLFETAKNLWRLKLEPALERIHGVTADTPDDAPERQAMARDARLVKTVILAALVPEVEAFRGLDASKLAALNWGSVKSPIPGNETQLVARKLRSLRLDVGELSIGDDPVNPTVSIILANVDTDQIVQRAIEAYDTSGARRQKVRELIGTALSNRLGEDLQSTLEHSWRGTKRAFDVVFGNVRDPQDLNDQAFIATGERPRLVIDFPFDEHGRTPEDDLDRLETWQAAHDPTHTVCWLPSFFNDAGVAALRSYLAIDEVLKLDRFDQYTTNLSASQRAEAKPILVSRRAELKASLQAAILAAYGVGGKSELVDDAASLTDHYRALDNSLAMRATHAPNLEGALGQLCDQMLDQIYPSHPKFETMVTTAQIRTTWEQIRRVLASEDDWVTVENRDRKAVRNVANAMGLGDMREARFNLHGFRQDQLDRVLNDAKAKGEALTVADLRADLDTIDGTPAGLEPQVADLVIMTVAAQADHALRFHGRPYEPTPGKPMDPAVTLEPEQLPTPDQWNAARERASVVFGLTVHSRVTGPELSSLVRQLGEKISPLLEPARNLVKALTKLQIDLGVDSHSRFFTAQAALELLEKVDGAPADEIVEALASFTAPTSDQAVAKSLSSAGAVARSIGDVNVPLWNGAWEAVGSDATALLQADEVVKGFATGASDVERRATAWMTARNRDTTTETGTETGATSAPLTSVGGKRTVAGPESLESVKRELDDALAEHGSITITWTSDT